MATAETVRTETRMKRARRGTNRDLPFKLFVYSPPPHRRVSRRALVLLTVSRQSVAFRPHVDRDRAGHEGPWRAADRPPPPSRPRHEALSALPRPPLLHLRQLPRGGGRPR